MNDSSSSWIIEKSDVDGNIETFENKDLTNDTNSHSVRKSNNDLSFSNDQSNADITKKETSFSIIAEEDDSDDDFPLEMLKEKASFYLTKIKNQKNQFSIGNDHFKTDSFSSSDSLNDSISTNHSRCKFQKQSMNDSLSKYRPKKSEIHSLKNNLIHSSESDSGFDAETERLIQKYRS